MNDRERLLDFRKRLLAMAATRVREDPVQAVTVIRSLHAIDYYLEVALRGAPNVVQVRDVAAQMDALVREYQDTNLVHALGMQLPIEWLVGRLRTWSEQLRNACP